MEIPSHLYPEVAQNIGIETANLQNSGMMAIILKAKIFQDGDKWCCLYGEIQTGICGFGDTPQKAVWAFENEYYGVKKLS